MFWITGKTHHLVCAEKGDLAKMELSPQQQSVMSWASEQQGHLNLVARAGTGKTTTLIEMCSRVPGTIFLGAYNKKIAEEIKMRLQESNLPLAQSSTMHAAGFGAWKRVSPSCSVDGNKLFNIAREMGIKKEEVAPICQAVSLAKQSLLQPPIDFLDWEVLWDHFEIDTDLPLTPRVAEIANNILAKSILQNEEFIDFDDMIYAPLVSGCRVPTYDWVFIDEAQDTNASRRELAIRMLNGSGRLVAVGDERQAIYGFTGADSDSMQLIQDHLGSVSLPLTLTYRCPKSVVRLAQTWVKDIEAFETNPEGAVRELPEERFSIQIPGNQDVILCRNSKPLIELAYMAIKAGRGVRVEGREIGKGLLKLAQRFKEDNLREILPRLARYQEEETSRLREKRKFNQIQNLEDKCETLSLMISQSLETGGRTIQHLEKRIESLFGDTYGKQTLLTLSTIHKAKGREWDHVWLWGRNRYQPSYYAKLSLDRGVLWPMEQERNLCYVAVTRTKQILTEIGVQKSF
jgi:superfamily I DNA/RNA helicase